jgi:hypothetical protein
MLHKRILKYMTTQNRMVSRLKINATTPLLLLSNVRLPLLTFKDYFRPKTSWIPL